MKLQFDANQQFQLDAVAAVTDLFDGQPRGAPDYAVIDMGAGAGLFAGQQQTELGAGNQLLVAEDKLLANARILQIRNDIEVADPKAALEAWELFDGPANRSRNCPHFSVEMETGTGKTYVYLRTVFELSRRYGFQKFIIVVPSVAIREGVLKNIEITAEHFRALYNNLPFEHFVYDARKVNRLRQFATSNTLQILVINIDAFRKNFTGTEAEQKSNVIYKESDKLSGRQPIEFVQAARPIVIIDEPQSVDSTDKAQEAIKALSLFFVDRVANYRDYDAAGQPVKGKFAETFEAELAALAKDERFRELEWLKQPMDKIHNGYFAQDKKGVLKDTRGDTQADDEVYNLIMKEKERLLSIDEPLRFIFSHSALREGWDNPNVFQICTLNETRSAVKKRQEIGRGLRLPVDQNGLRVFDESVNKLYVMANESYEDFARALQNEYEEECGVTFGKVPLTALAKIIQVVDGEERPIGHEVAVTLRDALVNQKMLDAEGRIQPAFDPKRKDFKLELPAAHSELAPAIIDLLAAYQIERHIRRERDDGPNKLKKEVTLSPEFQALWNHIKPRTTYRVEFETDKLVALAVAAIRRMEKIEIPKIHIVTGQIGVTKGGVTTAAVGAAQEQASYLSRAIPDVLAYLQNETELTRSTLVRILKESGKLGEFFNNPQRFLDAIATILKYELHRLLVDGIKYERIDGTGSAAEWEMLLFKNEELINYLTALQVEKSVYEYVVYESEVERKFAQGLDEREDIKLFVKLPGWFEIDTPVGKYNPDWAILKHDDKTLYLVRETKSTKDFLKLRTSEADKVRCGQKHFETLGVPFAVAVTADEV